MTRFPKEMTENGIHYTLHGDYYFPDLDLPDSPRQTIGRYGRMRKAYLEEHRPGLYERLLLSGKLYDHLAETDQVCRDRMEQIITRMAKAEGINEQLAGFPGSTVFINVLRKSYWMNWSLPESGSPSLRRRLFYFCLSDRQHDLFTQYCHKEMHLSGQ